MAFVDPSLADAQQLQAAAAAAHASGPGAFHLFLHGKPGVTRLKGAAAADARPV